MSTPPLRVELSSEEDRTLQELRAAPGVPQRTKDRAEALRLSHRGWIPHQIAEYLGWQVATARRAIHRWQQDGLYGLWDSPRSGRRPQCSMAVISTPAQLNPRPKMLWCPQSGHHSILGLGFNYDHLLNDVGENPISGGAHG